MDTTDNINYTEISENNKDTIENIKYNDCLFCLDNSSENSPIFLNTLCHNNCNYYYHKNCISL